MQKLKSPATWLGFLCAVGALLLVSKAVPEAAHVYIELGVGILGLAGSWFFDAPKAAGAVLVLFAALSLSGCASINKFVCGQSGHLVPPDAQLCTVAALQAASEIAVNVPACAASPTSAACIDAIISAGKDLSPCLPVCVSDAKQARAQAVASNVLRSNVCASLKSTGHASACK